MGIVLVGSCSGGSYLVGNCPVGVVLVRPTMRVGVIVDTLEVGEPLAICAPLPLSNSAVSNNRIHSCGHMHLVRGTSIIFSSGVIERVHLQSFLGGF